MLLHMKDDDKGYIGEALKRARIAKGLSQKELGQSVGMPQSHISKIESGLVDLQISTLTELSRTLDLEPMLVPRQLVRTLQALMKGNTSKEPRPMYRLDKDEDEDEA